MIASAERSGETSGLDFKVDMMVRRMRTFRGAASGRNRRCSYGDVWALSPPVEMVVARRALLKTFSVSKADGPFELIRTPAGPYWIPRRDIDTLAETLVEQQNDVYEGAVGMRAGDVVLDCGANVGAYTRHALDKGAKLVVAIEMAPESLECLRRNLAREVAGGRVIIYPKGVWNKEDELQLSTGDEWASTASSVVLDRGKRGPKVPLTTIDNLVAELQLSSVDFIKMDIEGAEMQALEGARDTVRRFHPRMAISVEHRPTDPDQIPGVVHGLWPDYVSECGPCANVNGSIQPDVLFAQARLQVGMKLQR
jgi:FkbM family methyltransferase